MATYPIPAYLLNRLRNVQGQISILQGIGQELTQCAADAALEGVEVPQGSPVQVNILTGQVEVHDAPSSPE